MLLAFRVPYHQLTCKCFTDLLYTSSKSAPSSKAECLLLHGLWQAVQQMLVLLHASSIVGMVKEAYPAFMSTRIPYHA